MNRFRLIITGFLLVGALSACSHYATNGEKLYLQSKNGPGVRVPPPLTDSNISPFYNLPNPTKPVSKVSIEPPIVAPEEKDS